MVFPNHKLGSKGKHGKFKGQVWGIWIGELPRSGQSLSPLSRDLSLFLFKNPQSRFGIE